VPRRRDFLAALGGGALAGVAGCTAHPPVAASADRPLDAAATTTFRRGLHRRGYDPDATVPDAVTVAWERPVNPGDHTAAKASAVPDGRGNYLVPGDDGVVRSLTPAGGVNWRAETEPSTRGIHGTPTVANGDVYVGAYDGALYAFDVETGERQWRRSLGVAIGSSPGYRDGTVYVAVEHHPPDGSLAAVDAATGVLRWRDSTPTDHPHSTLAVDRERGVMVCGSNDGGLYGWSWPDPTHEWTVVTDGAIKGPVAIHDGAAFAGSWDRNVYRVDLETGDVDWTVETGGLVMSGPGIAPDEGVVYVGSHDGRLRAIDAATGEVAWRVATEGRITGCPAVTDERVVVGSYDGRVYAVERDGGDPIWTVDLGAGHVSSSPLITDDGVLVAARHGRGEDGPVALLEAA